MIKTLQSINVLAIVDDAIMDHEADIIKLNQSQMYDKGIINIDRPTDKQRYAARTIKIKKKHARYPKTDFITLKWDGTFHESLSLDVRSDEVEIISDDPKYESELAPRYNPLGLTSESWDSIKPGIKDNVIKSLRNVI